MSGIAHLHNSADLSAERCRKNKINFHMHQLAKTRPSKNIWMKRIFVRTLFYGKSVVICSVTDISAQDAFSQLDALNPLVVTGSQVIEPLRDTPVRTEVIDGKYLSRTGTRSLAEAVEYSPGLRVSTNCQNCSVQSIQMLGLPQQYIGILSDGLPNFSTLAGVYGIEQIPAGTIGQIEIVKGGGSVLYGPGAVAGVINLIPREPTQTSGHIDMRFLGSRGDNFGQEPGGSFFGLYDFVSKDERFKLSMYGGFDRIDPIDRDGDGFTDVSKRDLWSGGLRALWRPVIDHTFTLDLFASDEDRRGGDILAWDLQPNEGRISEEILSRRYVSTLKWQADWSERWSSRLAYSYSRTERDSYYGGTGALGSPDLASPFFDASWTSDRGFGTTTDDLHFLDTLFAYQPSEEHRISFGGSFSRENLTDTQPSVNRTLDETFRNLGVFVQHRWKPNDVWTFEYGVRSDLNSELDDPIFSPRAAILWSPNNDLRVRGAISTGFRAPELFDEDLHISNVGGELQTTFNDPSLEEESSVTLSVSPEWQINESWRLEMNAFHTWLDDTFVVEPNDDPLTPGVTEFIRTNGESSRVYGAELNLGYFRDDWNIQFSWVQQRLEYDNPQLVLGDPNGDPADNPIFSSTYVRTPESLALLRFTHNGDWFDSYVTAKATGPMNVPRISSNPATGDLIGNKMERSPWFFNIDVGISRKFEMTDGDLTVSVGVKNLFDEFQNDLETGVFRDSDYVYGPAFSRTFYAGLRYDF